MDQQQLLVLHIKLITNEPNAKSIRMNEIGCQLQEKHIKQLSSLETSLMKPMISQIGIK